MPHHEKTGGDAQLRTLAANVEEANTVAVYEKFGTQHDELDMDRMGKLQQLRVSNFLRREYILDSVANRHLAELQVLLYHGFLCDSRMHLGVFISVRQSSSITSM